MAQRTFLSLMLRARFVCMSALCVAASLYQRMSSEGEAWKEYVKGLGDDVITPAPADMEKLRKAHSMLALGTYIIHADNFTMVYMF